MTDSPRWLIDSTVYNALVLSGGTDENVNGLFDLYTKKMQDYQSAPADNKPSAYPKIKDIYDFIESQNVDLAKFQSNMSSDEMKDIQKRDRKIFEDSKLGGVPAFIVNNKYLITGTDVKSYDEYFEKVSAVLKKTNK
jgi:protein-disulfide isomerase